MKKVLMLATNPKDTSLLRLDEEFREIDARLWRYRKRGELIVEQKLAVRVDDIRRAMLDVEPQIVHFFGHGTTEKGLVLQDDSGRFKRVNAVVLARLFKLFRKQIECVVLNGCYSKVQAKAIAQHVEYVIGIIPNNIYQLIKNLS